MVHISTPRARVQATAAFVGGLVLWWRVGGVYLAVLAGVLALLTLLAWIAPERYKPMQRVFDMITRVFVAGFSWVMLGLVYFCLFTPIRLIGSMMGRDPLRLKPGRSNATYLSELPSAQTGRFDRQF